MMPAQILKHSILSQIIKNTFLYVAIVTSLNIWPIASRIVKISKAMSEMLFFSLSFVATLMMLINVYINMKAKITIIRITEYVNV